MMNTGFGRAYSVESYKNELQEGPLLKASSLYVERSLVFDFGARIMETWVIDHAEEIGKFGHFC